MWFNTHPALKFVVPFIRTPANLLKFSLERSPAAPLVKEWRRDFAAGGARRDPAVARAMVGTGVGALVAELAANGQMTGNGPADPRARSMLLADGWQPYSIRVGDRYYSYQRLDPFASTLGAAAGLVELQDHMTDKQQEEVAGLLVASVLQNMASKTWLSGIGDLTEAIKEPSRYADDWLRRLAGSVAVPAGVAQVARTIDPDMREAETILDGVRARVPGLSMTLPPRRDVLGQELRSEGGLSPDIVTPIWQSTRNNDPVINALLDSGITIGKLSRVVGGERLNNRDWDRYQDVAGALMHNALGGLVQSPGWQALPREEQEDEVDGLVRAVRKSARQQLFGERRAAHGCHRQRGLRLIRRRLVM